MIHLSDLCLSNAPLRSVSLTYANPVVSCMVHQQEKRCSCVSDYYKWLSGTSQQMLWLQSNAHCVTITAMKHVINTTRGRKGFVWLALPYHTPLSWEVRGEFTEKERDNHWNKKLPFIFVHMTCSISFLKRRKTTYPGKAIDRLCSTLTYQ